MSLMNITGPLELASALGCMYVSDSNIDNIIASCNKTAETTKLKTSAYNAVYRELAMARPARGHPQGVVLTSVAAGAQTQNTLNAFNSGSDTLTLPKQTTDKRSMFSKILGCSFRPDELYVEIPLTHLDAESLHVLRGSLFRPALGHFINSINAEYIEDGMVLHVDFNHVELFRYRLHPSHILAIVYKQVNVNRVEWDYNASMTCMIHYSYKLSSVLERYSEENFMLKFLHFRVTMVTELDSLQSCMIRNAVGSRIDINRRTVTLYGPVYLDIVQHQYLLETIGLDALRAARTNDVVQYGKLHGILDAQALQISLLVEAAGANQRQWAVNTVRGMYAEGYYMKNNSSNLLRASRNVQDSLIEGGVVDKYTGVLGYGVVSDVNTVSTHVMTSSAPHLGTAVARPRVTVTPPAVADKEIMTTLLLTREVGRAPASFITTTREISVRISDIVSVDPRIRIGPLECVTIDSLLQIQYTEWGYTMSVDARSEFNVCEQRVLLGTYRVPPSGNAVTIVLFNSADRAVAIDLRHSKLLIVSPCETTWACKIA